MSPRVAAARAAGVPPTALELAAEIAADAGRRVDPPVRVVFVRDFDGRGEAPLARLVGTGGRGGAVAVKLYLALLWRCSKPPFDTNVPARMWAALLGLPDPEHRGARRITDALRVLKDAGLIHLIPRPGDSSEIRLREESGLAEYTLPSNAYVQESDSARRARSIYFKVPVALWTQGHIQAVSAPALAMLLVCLANEGATGKKMWWSTTVFPAQYGLSPATRARGTAELEDRGLLRVKKELVSDFPGQKRTFTRERVRNTYILRGAARFPAPPTKTAARTTSKVKPRPRPRKKAGAAPKANP